MKSVVIDANGYLRLFLNDVPEQASKVELLLKNAKKNEVQVFLPQITVFEIIFILEKYYQLDKSEALDKVESLVSTSYIDVESRDIFLGAISIYRQAAVSFVDCFLIAYSQKNGAELVTFDKKLGRLK